MTGEADMTTSREAAETIRANSPTADTVLIGPPLVYNDDIVSVVVIAGPPDHITSVELGRLVSVPPALEAAADTVLLIMGPGDITMEQAHEERDKLADALRDRFATVRTFDDELALADAMAAHFPSERVLELRAQIYAEKQQ